MDFFFFVAQFHARTDKEGFVVDPSGNGQPSAETVGLG